MNNSNLPRLMRAMDMKLQRGVLVSAQDILKPGGVVETYHNGQLAEITPNIIPAAMRSYLAQAGYAGGAQTSVWYITPFVNAVDPADGLTGANFGATLAEFINYTEVTRPVWAQEAEANQAIENTTNMAEITAGAGGGTINGIVLISVNVKGNSSGLVGAATRFAAPRVMQAGDTLQFRYKMQINLPG